MIPPDKIAGRLESQRSLPTSTLVEFGHGATPIAYNQPKKFINGRQYIGIEAWTRDPQHGQLNMLRLIHDHNLRDLPQNIHYFAQYAGRLVTMIAGKDLNLEKAVCGPDGQLKPGLASEVYASDVLTDPMVGRDPFRSLELLKQMGNVAQRDGLVVVRETYSPEVWLPSSHQEQQHIARAGLKRISQIRPCDPAWSAMEKLHQPAFISKKPPHRNIHISSRYDVYEPLPP